jgi:hypothetical protein
MQRDCVPEEALNVKGSYRHCDRTVGIARPLSGWTVDHQLKPIAIRIGQVHREVDPMVGRSEQLVTRSQQSNDDFSQCAHVRETQSEVMETGRSCPCWLRLAIPSVQCNMMVIVASGEKRGVVIALCDPQADYVSIKRPPPGQGR